MPITPQGWPYMNGSDLVYRTPNYTQELAAVLAATVGQGTPLPTDPPLDTGWVDITSSLLPDFTTATSLQARAAYGMTEIRVDVQPNSTWSTGTTTFASDVPATFRPSASKFAACYAGGQSWIAFSRSNGELAVTNTSSSTSTARCQATILFMS